MGRKPLMRQNSAIDKKVIIRDRDLKKRTRWAINYIAMTRDLSNQQMATAISLRVSTFASYRSMKTSPKSAFIEGFCSVYGLNETWLIQGIGEPFPGVRMQRTDVCGQEEPSATAPIYNKDTVPPAGIGDAQKINIEEAMGKTYEVLKSGTPYAVALYLNIQQFKGAVDTTREVQVCHELITGLQAQVDDLRRQMLALTAPPITAEQREVFLEKEAM